MNNFRFGFTGVFTVLPSEDQDEFDHLFHGLCVEQQPSTMTERLLVEKMAQAHWLSKRAQLLQDLTIDADLPEKEQERKFALYLRYQTSNDRAFHRCLNDVLKLRAEKRRTEIGFESQQQKQADQLRREAGEKRKQDLHGLAVLLAEAKVDHQIALTSLQKSNVNAAAIRENGSLQVQKAA